MKHVDAVSSVLDRLMNIGPKMSASDLKLLGIDQEDLVSYTEDMSADAFKQGIKDIVENAYKNVPAYKDMIEKDLRQYDEFKRFRRAPKPVDKLIDHVKSMAPSYVKARIPSDTYSYAHDIVKDVIKDTQPLLEAPAPEKVPEELSASDLGLFGMRPSDISSDIKQSRVDDAIMYFLNKAVGPDGKRIPNKATRKMPVELKADYIARFLNQIRSAKIKEQGELKDFEKKWLGNDLKHLKSIAKGYATPAEKKKPDSLNNNLMVVKQKTVDLILIVNRILDILKNDEYKKDLASITTLLNQTLPPADDVTHYVDKIRSELLSGDYTPQQKALLLDIKSDSLSYDPPDPLKDIKDIESKIQTLSRKDKLSESDQAILDNLKNRMEAYRGLISKDTKPIIDLIHEYLDMLNDAKYRARNLVSKVNIDDMPSFINLKGYINDLIKKFHDLSRESRFQGRWKHSRGRLVHTPYTPSKIKDSNVSMGVIAASVSVPGKTYGDKLGHFQNTGIESLIENLEEYSEEGGVFEEFRDKLLSVAEATANASFNPTGKDFTGNPYAGKGRSISDYENIFKQLQSSFKKFDMDKKLDAAYEILSWASDLSSKYKDVKKASTLGDYLRRYAMSILNAADEDGPQKSKGMDKGRTSPASSSGKANLLIYRERLTKMGRKYLENFFEESPLTEEIVEEMERRGLGLMITHGDVIAKEDIVPALKEMVDDIVHPSGDMTFMDTLMSKAIREITTKYDIKKLRKEYDEANKRIRSLRQKIVSLKKNRLPVLRQWSEFLRSPVSFLKSMPAKKSPDRQAPKDTSHKMKVREDVSIDSMKDLYRIVDSLAHEYGILYRQQPTRETLKHLNKSPSPEQWAEYYENKREAAVSLDFSYEDDDEFYQEHTKKVLLPSTVLDKYKSRTSKYDDMKDKVNDLPDPITRGERIEDFYERAVDLYEYTKKYVDGDIKKKLQADKKAINEALMFIETRFDARKVKPINYVPDLKSKQDFIDTLDNIEEKINQESEAYDKLQKELDQDRQKYVAYKHFYDLTKEMVDQKKWQAIQDIADAPEMKLKGKDREEAKKRVQERGKGRSYISDINTFKNFMKHIGQAYHGRTPGKFTMPDGSTFVLPKERAKQFLVKRRQLEDELERLKNTIREWEESHKLKAFYERGLKSIKDIKESLRHSKDMLNEYIKTIKDAEAYIEEHRDEPSDIDYNKMEKLIKDAKASLEGEKSEIEYLSTILSQAEQFEDLYEKELDDIKELEKLQRIEREKGKSQRDPATLRKLINDLSVTKMFIKESQAIPEKAKKDRIDDINRNISRLQTQLQREVNKKFTEPAMAKSAAAGSSDDKLTPYEWAIENKGVKPDVLKKIKKPKGWYLLEDFEDQTKKEMSYLKEKDIDDIPKVFWEDPEGRLEELAEIRKAIDLYKKNIIEIAGEESSMEDAVQKFEDMLLDYQERLTQLNHQLEDAHARSKRARILIKDLESYFDENGKFVGFSEEEEEWLTKLFWRLLYKQMDKHWSQKVGKRIDVFGERDREWYNNVYSTFKNLQDTRSNKKLLSLLDTYKKETRSDFDDMKHSLKVNELKDDLEKLIDGMNEAGVSNPSKMQSVKILKIRIDNLEALAKQKEVIFNEMAKTVDAALHAKIEEALKGLAGGTVKDPKGEDLDKKVDKGVDEVVGKLNINMDHLVKIGDMSEDIEQSIKSIAKKENIKEEEKSKGSEIAKKSYHDDPNFNLSILYGPVMQEKIAEMLS